jgi:hypothetical protein
MFTPAEKAEIAASLGVQVALAFTGAEEIKVAMNVAGALGGVRGVIETARRDPNWETNSRFWSSLIGMALSVVGLKHSLAATKITTLILRFGWIAAAVPPLAQMVAKTPTCRRQRPVGRPRKPATFQSTDKQLPRKPRPRPPTSHKRLATLWMYS